MKRFISVLLVFCLFAVPVTVITASAADDLLTTVYYVTLPESKEYTCTPCDGYSQYVPAGQEFKFKITPADGYSLSMVMVSYYSDTGDKLYNIETKVVNDVYTIDAVTENLTVDISYVMEKQQASFFRSLLEFLRQILNWLAETFNIPVGDQDII